ncbi:MAG TPA: alpha/beta hydrolase [Polyangiaceae bacterium]|nr:alpha/beta hydrolase [Polyangiaceae bacterium]
MTLREQGPLARALARGPALYFYSARPAGDPVAAAGLVHGYGEYGARYERVMDAWAERGIASFALDLRGHGRAEGRRGYCRRFEDYIDDVAELERLTQSSTRGVPMFLFGHSFGGLVAASFAAARPGPWRGLMLSAPLLAIAMDVPPLKRLAGKLASRLLPTLALPNGIRSEDITHDAELARAYEKDPLVFHIATARWFSEVGRAQRRAFDRASSLRIPLYVVMGTEDRIASYERARALFDAAGAIDKTWDSRPGLFHEVLNEPEWRAIAGRLADFMLAHV